MSFQISFKKLFFICQFFLCGMFFRKYEMPIQGVHIEICSSESSSNLWNDSICFNQCSKFGVKTRLKLFFLRWFIIFELDRVQLKSFVQFVNSNVDNLNLLRENWVESIPKLSMSLPQCLPRFLSYPNLYGRRKIKPKRSRRTGWNTIWLWNVISSHFGVLYFVSVF